VVADVIAAGATTRAALRVTRLRHPRELVLAVSLAPLEALAAMREEVDDVVCLESHESFGAIAVHFPVFIKYRTRKSSIRSPDFLRSPIPIAALRTLSPASGYSPGRNRCVKRAARRLIRIKDSETDRECSHRVFGSCQVRNVFERRTNMAEAVTKLAVKTEKPEEKAGRLVATAEASPFAGLRREIDRLFDDFAWGPGRSPFRRPLFDIEPFWRGELAWGKAPAVDIADTAKAYEITAELPGMDEKNVEVKLSDGTLTIKGEKKDEKEEKNKDYYLSERRYGSFQRSFNIPDGIDAEKIEAAFKNGILTVTFPKTPETQKKEKKIEIKKG
jgi:HSP20 family protein